MVASSSLMTAGVSASLLVAVVVQLGCQIFKVVEVSVRTRTFAWHRLLAAGGMPSSHTAFVASLSTAIAIRAGIGSELFAIACVFSMITVYDTIRVRGAIQINSDALRQVFAPMPAASRPQAAQDVGHTLAEIGVGLLIGIGAALAARALHLL